LLESKNYYFEEVSTIGTLIKQSKQPFQNLFILVDEFKGTNTEKELRRQKLFYLT